ncbi:hypothetical protein Q3G72_018524 [Acer saccharum]|nr:hypothetical protein Q3G72_018524 [Acer saccharum]
MEGNIHEKDREPQDLNNEVNCTQDSNLVKAKGLKKKETSKGRRRIKSSLEKALAKRKKLSNRLPHFQASKEPPSQLSPKVVDFPYPLSHSPTYKPQSQLSPIVGDIQYQSTVYNPYSFQQQLQSCSASNPMANTPYERSQQTNFQALLQQNMQNFTSAFQDSQTSNSSSLLE